MKTIAIHQPHYFPWLGYLDKMAKADEFIILDEVQLTDSSPMVRNKFLELNGEAKLLSVSIEKKGYQEKPTKDIKLCNWHKIASKHRKFIEQNYRRTKGFDDVMPRVTQLFEEPYDSLLELDMATIDLLRAFYAIDGSLVMQSSLSYRADSKNTFLVFDLCASSGADTYLSGRGAKAYMDEKLFQDNGIQVVYQEFQYPQYAQYKQEDFIPNLSALDMVFQCGIEEAREVFWENVEGGK